MVLLRTLPGGGEMWGIVQRLAGLAGDAAEDVVTGWLPSKGVMAWGALHGTASQRLLQKALQWRAPSDCDLPFP